MPGLLLFLSASRVSFQPGIDPFGLQPNRTPAADARVPQFLALARRVDGVPAHSRRTPQPSATFNQGFIAQPS